MSTKKQELFSQAYSSYRELSDKVEQVNNEPDFSLDSRTAPDLLLNMDMCLQYLMIKLQAVALLLKMNIASSWSFLII